MLNIAVILLWKTKSLSEVNIGFEKVTSVIYTKLFMLNQSFMEYIGFISCKSSLK